MLRHRVLTQAMLWIIRGLVKDYPRPCARSVAVRAHARALRAHWQTKCARIILGDYQKLPGIIPLCARSARCARRVYHVVAYQCYTKQHGNCSRSLRVLSRDEALSLPDDCIYSSLIRYYRGTRLTFKSDTARARILLVPNIAYLTSI